MSYNEILLCVLGTAVVSYGPRVLPFALLGGKKLPKFFARWLQFVPTAVFGALIFTSIFCGPDKTFRFALDNIEMLASIFAVVAAAKTKSLAYSIIAGAAAYWCLKQFL